MKIVIEVSDEIADIVQRKLGLDIETLIKGIAQNMLPLLHEVALARDADVKISQEEINKMGYEFGIRIMKEARDAKRRKDEQQTGT
jgi:hypothetical protein